MTVDTTSLLVVVAVAAAAPLIADLPRRLLLPIVVLEILLGIAVGPEVLGLVEGDDLLEVLATFGLCFLFFLAGLEIDFARLGRASLALATLGWMASVAIALALCLGLWAAGAIDAPVLVGLALTTTALGTLAPILRDAGWLERPIGQRTLAVGAIGELGPIVGLSLILAVQSGHPLRALLLVAFAISAAGMALLAARWRPRRLSRLVEATMHTSAQLAIRLALLLLTGLVVLALEFGLDLVLGAFTAGLIVGLITRDAASARDFEVKLDAVGFGFLVPIFFIMTGVDFDLSAILESPGTVALVPLFALLFLAVRGLPTILLSRRAGSREQAMPLGLMAAAGLPLIVAITEVATDAGEMTSQMAAALVGAGMLSVLVYPLLALALERRSRGGG